MRRRQHWSIYPTLIGWTGGPDIELRNNVAGAAYDGVNYVELDTNFEQPDVARPSARRSASSTS